MLGFAIIVATGLALLSAIVLLIRLPKFQGQRRCTKCGYARQGLPITSVCPECGHPHDLVATPALPRYMHRFAYVTILSLILSLTVLCVLSLVVRLDLIGYVFLAVFFAIPLIGLGAILAAAPLHGGQMFILAACAMLPPAAATALAAFDAFVWHPAAQSGMVVLALPLITGFTACWGLLIGAGILHLLARARRSSTAAAPTPSPPATT